MEKVCATRASKQHPHVWTKAEVVALAVEQLGMTTTKARQHTKAELCHLLGLPVPPPSSSVPPSQTPSKICTTNRNVPRYTRADLEKAALALGKTKKEIRALSYPQLCVLLKLPTAPPTPPPTTSMTSTTSHCIERSNKALRDHQKAVLRYMDTHRGLIVFHKVGSGKTLTAITVSQCYLDQHPTHRVLVIAPAGLLHNFRDEMTQSYVHLKHKDRYEFYSYQKFTSLVKKHKKPICQNTLVIVDEGHNLRTPFKESKKNPTKSKGILTKNVLDCAEKAHKVLILTGTPLYNSQKDIFTLFNMIRDKGTPEIPTAAYAKNSPLGETSFQRLFCKISYHDTSKDPNFPVRINREHPVVMSPEYQAKYLQVVEKVKNHDIQSALVSHLFGEKNLAVFFNALRRAVNNLDNTAANRKLEWLVNTLRSFPPHEKVIVFSNFLDAGLRLVEKKLPASISYAVIEGKIPMDKRKDIVRDFNQNKYRVLFLSKAGGEGLDMKGVRHVILMDPTWNEASNEQVIGRAIRYRSHADLPADQRNVTVHRLLHILPEDVPVLQKVGQYLQHPQQMQEPELDPFINSLDVYLSYFERKKQITLDKYNALLQSYSIEKNQC